MHRSPRNTAQPARLAALALSACLAGCSVTVDTLGTVGDDPTLYRGTSTGYADMTGTIEMATTDGGNRCTGNFEYETMQYGYGSLTCSDGKSARIRFTALGMTAGYGTGVTSEGEVVRFVYGMKDAEAAYYLRDMRADARSGTAGAGFFISTQGDLLTAAHVVLGCKSAITLQTASGAGATANITAIDMDLDLAILQAPSGPAAVPHWAASPSQVGDRVAAYRFPTAGQSSGAGDVATGQLTALSGVGGNAHYLQMNAPVRDADGGGPLADASGQVIGVIAGWLSDKQGGTAKGSDAQAINFAIKGDIAKTFLNKHGIDVAAPAAGNAGAATDMGDTLRNSVVQLGCQTVS